MGYRDGEVETLEDANRHNSHPLVATIIGSIVILLITAGGSASAAKSGPEAIGYALGSGVFALLIVGGAAWFITLRHASDGWKVGSLITLFLVGLLGGLASVGTANMQRRADARELAGQMQHALDTAEGARPEIREGSGPLAKMAAAMLRDINADSAVFEDEAQSAGLSQIITLEGLTKASPVLGDCGGLDRMADHARRFGSRGPEILNHARAVGEAEVQKGSIEQRDVDEFLAGASENHGLAQQWGYLAEISSEAGSVCRLLATRKWALSGGRILFLSNADARAANLHLDRIRQLQTQVAAVRANARASAQSQIEEMKRLGP